ncbi:MAG TPA: ribosome-associated translation inhibitor RaiA [archaeon]|nr:ribosome-associated translation inhibitor RaiA [archaeon]
MQVTITRKNAGLSESLKSYIEKKLWALTKRYQKIIDARVVMDLQGKDHLVEINVRVARHTLFSKKKSTNLRAAIDACVNKLDKQLIKHKGKVRRKSLTPEEAVLSGKVIQVEIPETESVQSEKPELTIEGEDLSEEYEEKTGTS